jgi:hypothetical protein
MAGALKGIYFQKNGRHHGLLRKQRQDACNFAESCNEIDSDLDF